AEHLPFKVGTGGGGVQRSDTLRVTNVVRTPISTPPHACVCTARKRALPATSCTAAAQHVARWEAGLPSVESHRLRSGFVGTVALIGAATPAAFLSVAGPMTRPAWSAHQPEFAPVSRMAQVGPFPSEPGVVSDIRAGLGLKVLKQGKKYD